MFETAEYVTFEITDKVSAGTDAGLLHLVETDSSPDTITQINMWICFCT